MMKKEILIPTAILSLLLLYVGNRFGDIVDNSASFLSGITLAIERTLSVIVAYPFYVGAGPWALLLGFGACLALWCIWTYFFATKGNRREGIEAGSARWGTLKEGRKFKDTKDPYNNLILSQNYGIAIKRKKFDLSVDRNLNCLVIGGSGSGKTRYYIKPNLLNQASSYFVTDPKGTMLGETGQMFEDAGYRLSVFNTIQFDQSSSYNPLAYVKTDADILSFVNCFIRNTNGGKDGGNSDPFWENSERLLYTALIAYLRDWCHPQDYNLPGLLILLGLAKASEDDETRKSPLDFIFDEIKTGKRVTKLTEEGGAAASAKLARSFAEGQKTDMGYAPSNLVRRSDGIKPGDPEVNGLGPDDDFALKNYELFKTAAGKTLKSIIISCNVRTAPLAINEVKSNLYKDEMALDKMGDEGRRSIIYAVMSDTDKTFSFLHAILMWQAIDQLCQAALKKYGGRLPTLVNFLLDEFANIGTIPDIEQTIAVTRSRNIAISIILQSISQLRSRYSEEDAKVIIDCCDTTVLLGGKSQDTNEEFSKIIGKETIQALSFNQSKGANASYSINHQQQARELMDAAEIGRLDRSMAIVLIAGFYPLRNKKFKLESHPRYKYIDPGHKGSVYPKSYQYRRPA